MSSQNKLYAYILMYVPHSADADDIIQETASVAWEKFHTFTPGTDFARWIRKIAHHKILDHRKRGGVHRVVFSDELIRMIADQAELVVEQTDSRLDALKSCLKRLSAQDRQLLRWRYEEGITIKKMAEQADRPLQGLYKVMVRIHDQLRRCVNFTLLSREVFE